MYEDIPCVNITTLTFFSIMTVGTQGENTVVAIWVRMTNPTNKIKFVANEPKPV